MKKLLCIAAALFCLTACGGSAENKTVTCTSKKATLGNSIETTIDFTYAGNLVKKQVQKTEMKLKDKDTFDQMRPLAEASSLESKVKGMDGVNYSIDSNETDFLIDETVAIDIAKISTEDYATLTGKSSSSVKTTKIDMKKTRSSMMTQGYTCTAMD